MTREENQTAYVVSASGGGPRRLAVIPLGGKWPYWSRDGQWVYFANESPPAGIWRVGVRGGNPTQITQDGGDVPQESPDGKFVYYLQVSSDPLSVWRVSVNGGQPKKVFDSVHPSGLWFVAEKGIYFVRSSNQGLRTDLCFYDFATERSRAISMLRSGVGFVAPSPDGRYVLYSQRDAAGSDLMLVENFR
jgi:Tol biopolymer transport system component